MADLAALLASVAIPWLVGTLAMLAVAPADHPRWLRAAGYGYFLGLFATTLAIRLLDALALRWTAANVCVPLVAVALVAGWYVRRRRHPTQAPPSAMPSAMSPVWQAAFCVLVVLTLTRIALVGFDALTLPLVPVDTWSQWASKARVWFAYRELAPFVEPGQWAGAAGAMHFTDSHPAYPPTVPLFQVWTAFWLGRWDETLVNVAWPVSLVALGLAVYGDLRRFGIAPIAAMFVTYALLSLPFLTIYAALAGLADLFVASAFGLAAASTWHWTARRDRRDAIVAIAMAIFCANLKREGLLWDLTLVPGVLMALDRRLGVGALALAALGIVGYVAFGPAQLVVSDYILLNRLQNVLPYLYDHLFMMDNWHLLWYVAIVVLAFHWRTLVRDPVLPASATILAGVMFVFVVFFLTSAAIAVEEESLTNRLPFEMVPALVVYLALVVHAGQRRPHALAGAPA